MIFTQLTHININFISLTSMELNWSHSIMCQKETSEPVKCLSETHDLSGGRIDAYVSIFGLCVNFGKCETVSRSECTFT